ncbi:phage minor head protein [Enterococcus innesii]|uniref:phage head morphogenesis protein n=1 Tax=Enterococcus innesii TaxID=2839759 RepID=UPI003BE27D98
MSKYQKEIESLLNKSESNISKELQALYKDLANEVTKEIIELNDQIEKDDKFSKKLQKERLESIRSQMYAKASQLEGNQQRSLFNFLKHDAGTAYNELFYEFEMAKEIPLSFAMLTEKQITTIINTPVAGRKLSTRLKGNSTKMKKNLNRVLTRGFSKGWSTQKMAAQIAEIGGANYRRAMNIARTESGRVTSVTRQQSQQHAKDLGIKAQKKWISTLDGDTRNTHRQLDGQIRDIDDYFEIAGMKTLQPHMFGIASEDCNCRCRTINVIKGYEPKLRRDNETGEVSAYKNYQEWINSKREE